MSEIELVPKLSQKLIQKLLPSKDIAINSVDISIQSLNELARSLPQNYGWRVRSVEAFKAAFAKIDRTNESWPHEANRLYWIDMLKSFEAYLVMSTWRAVELARSCVWALGRDDILCAALTARAALEGTAQYLSFVRTIVATLSNVRSHDFRSRYATSQELEDLVLKTVWASRLPDAEPFYRPINIATIIEKHVGKIAGQEYVMPTYELLCEVAHPNYFGRSVYLVNVLDNEIKGDQTYTLARNHGSNAELIEATAIRALSWASMTHTTACAALSDSIKEFLVRLNS